MSSTITIDLAGKTAVVTGSTQGIGLAIARRLRDAGADVIVNGRSPDRVEHVAAQLGERVRGIAADVTTAEGAAQLIETAGAVDILVNNLGIFGSTPALEIDDEQWQRFLDTNVLSAARLIRLMLPAMAERG